MRPRCSTLTGGFDFSGCGDCTCCPPFKQAEMSNSELSAIVLQGVPCMCGVYTSFDSNGENGSFKIRRSRTAFLGSGMLKGNALCYDSRGPRRLSGRAHV